MDSPPAGGPREARALVATSALCGALLALAITHTTSATAFMLPTARLPVTSTPRLLAKETTSASSPTYPAGDFSSVASKVTGAVPVTLVASSPTLAHIVTVFVIAPLCGALAAIFAHLTRSPAPAEGGVPYVILSLGDGGPLPPRPLTSSRCPRRATALGLFGWFQNNKDVPGRDTMFEEQQRILQARRGGKQLEGLKERREKVSKYLRKELPPEEMASIKRRNEAKAKALSKEAVKGGLPLPMASFGMPEFDGGERFDLRGKYVDEGWVDESSKKSADWLPWNKKQASK